MKLLNNKYNIISKINDLSNNKYNNYNIISKINNLLLLYDNDIYYFYLINLNKNYTTINNLIDNNEFDILYKSYI